jgi:hypothetical protein
MAINGLIFVLVVVEVLLLFVLMALFLVFAFVVLACLVVFVFVVYVGVLGIKDEDGMAIVVLLLLVVLDRFILILDGIL